MALSPQALFSIACASRIASTVSTRWSVAMAASVFKRSDGEQGSWVSLASAPKGMRESDRIRISFGSLGTGSPHCQIFYIVWIARFSHSKVSMYMGPWLPRVYRIHLLYYVPDPQTYFRSSRNLPRNVWLCRPAVALKSLERGLKRVCKLNRSSADSKLLGCILMVNNTFNNWPGWLILISIIIPCCALFYLMHDFEQQELWEAWPFFSAQRIGPNDSW